MAAFATSEAAKPVAVTATPVQKERRDPAQAPASDLADPLSDPLQLLPMGSGGGGPPAGDPGDDRPGSSNLVQLLALSPYLQMKGGGAGAGVQRAAAHGLSGSGGSLPFGAQIQKSFGKHDISGVRAHTDTRAREGAGAMGARAFASGSNVAFGGSPDLHTAAHEAAHVVQQQAGVQLKGGVGERGDRYERNADAVADAVVQGKSAESLLDPFSGGSGGAAVQLDVGSPGKAANTMAKDTDNGGGKKSNGAQENKTPTAQGTKVTAPPGQGQPNPAQNKPPATPNTSQPTQTPPANPTPAGNDWTSVGAKERMQSKVGVGATVSEGYALSTEFEFKVYGPFGVRVAVDLGVERGASLSGEGTKSGSDPKNPQAPAPTRQWASNKELKTKFEGSVAVSAVFDLVVVKVDVGLKGKIEGEVKGDKTVLQAVKEVVGEMFKKQFKNTEERLKNAGGQLMMGYTEARGKVAKAYDDVIAMVKGGKSSKQLEENTSENWIFGSSPKEKVEDAYLSFQGKIIDMFKAVGQVQEGRAASTFFNPPDVVASMAEAGKAAGSQVDALVAAAKVAKDPQGQPAKPPSAAEIADMRIKALTESKGATLGKMDTNANAVFQKFNAFQAAQSNKSPDVSYKASATIFAGVRLGNGTAGAAKGEVKVNAGIMAMQQDGASTGIMATVGIDGKLEVAGFEVSGNVQVAGNMENRYLNAKVEGKTPTLPIPGWLDPTRLNVHGIATVLKGIFGQGNKTTEGGAGEKAAKGVWGFMKAGADAAGKEFKHNAEEGVSGVQSATSKITFGIEYEYTRQNLAKGKHKIAVSGGLERSIIGVEADASVVGIKVDAAKFSKVEVELTW